MSGGNLAPRLISPGYLAENKRLHLSGKYGRSGDKWLHVVLGLIEETGARDVLDYGCGKGNLSYSLNYCDGIVARDYDPAIEGRDALPKPADLVVCTDVLEHIEPECIEAVLDHLRKLTRVALFVAISTRLAGKHLSDGRNAHLLVRGPKWWQDTLSIRFAVVRTWQSEAQEWVALLKPRSARSTI
jgi:hypothetical protein